jgi:hypothetical protein
VITCATRVRGGGNAREKAMRLQMGRMARGVPFAIGDQVPWRRRALQGLQQRLGPLLANLCIGGVAIPAFAPKGPAAILGHHQCQDGLFQVRAVIFGVPMRHAYGLHIRGRDVRAGQRKTRRVEMIETQGYPFLDTDRQGECAEQQITAIGVDLIERAAELKAMEHLCVDVLMKQQVERFIGKEPRSQGEGPIGKPSTIDDHPGHGFTRCDHLLRIRHEACVNHINKTYVFDNFRNEPEMIQAFDADCFHRETSPESR